MLSPRDPRRQISLTPLSLSLGFQNILSGFQFDQCLETAAHTIENLTQNQPRRSHSLDKSPGLIAVHQTKPTDHTM